MTSLPGFVVQTCEGRVRAERSLPFGPPIGQSRSSPFPANDPFGLRKAVLPVFERDPSGMMTGLGTAFHVDGWGGCLTAEHVVDFMRAGVSLGSEVMDFVRDLDPLARSHPVVMLGLGLVFAAVDASSVVLTSNRIGTADFIFHA